MYAENNLYTFTKESNNIIMASHKTSSEKLNIKSDYYIKDIKADGYTFYILDNNNNLQQYHCSQTITPVKFYRLPVLSCCKDKKYKLNLNYDLWSVQHTYSHTNDIDYDVENIFTIESLFPCEIRIHDPWLMITHNYTINGPNNFFPLSMDAFYDTVVLLGYNIVTKKISIKYKKINLDLAGLNPLIKYTYNNITMNNQSCINKIIKNKVKMIDSIKISMNEWIEIDLQNDISFYQDIIIYDANIYIKSLNNEIYKYNIIEKKITKNNVDLPYKTKSLKNKNYFKDPYYLSVQPTEKTNLTYIIEYINLDPIISKIYYDHDIYFIIKIIDSLSNFLRQIYTYILFCNNDNKIIMKNNTYYKILNYFDKKKIDDYNIIVNKMSTERYIIRREDRSV